MTRSKLTVIWLVGILAVSCSAGGPPAREREEERAAVELFVGALEGSDAKIALVRNDAVWAAYVCGGASTFSSLTGWFQGDLAPHGAVSGRTDGKELAATFGDEGATGTLSVEGTGTIRFEASFVPRHAPGGLYQGISNGCRTGLIVPPSGSGESQGVYCADLEISDERVRLFEQVTPVAPITPGDDIVAARVLDASAQIIQLEKVALPLDST